MEDQVIFQNRRFSDEKKISHIHNHRNLLQTDITTIINLMNIFVNQE